VARHGTTATDQVVDALVPLAEVRRDDPDARQGAPELAPRSSRTSIALAVRGGGTDQAAELQVVSS
jgi:hypothetical protein